MSKSNPIIINKNSGVDIIFACDAHSQDGETLDEMLRHTALGRFVVKHAKSTLKQTVLVIGGDWGDFPSVNPHFSKLRNSENYGRRHSVLGDIIAFRSAIALLMKEIIEYNEAADIPILVFFTEGNHERYLPTTGVQFEELRDILGLENLQIRKFCEDLGIVWLDFEEKLVINGLMFCHVYKYAGQRLAIQTVYNRNDLSTVSGDGHENKCVSGRNALGKPRFSWMGGCWKADNNVDPEKDDLGISVFRNVYDSTADREWVSKSTVMREFALEENRHDADRFFEKGRSGHV